MSNCRLAISLDRPDGRFQAGEHVTGTVQVQVDKQVSCKELIIELLWQTHGRGNTTRETVANESIRAVEWSPGSPQSYSFSFTIPGKPLTYHGHDLNIDYYVKARADLPWKIDPTVTEEILVTPGPDSRESYRDDESVKLPKASKKAGPVGTIFIWLLSIVILGLLMVLFAAFWWFFALLGLIALGRKAMIFYANRRLGNVEVDCETRVVPGKKLSLALRFNPPGSVAISAITASLAGKEVVTSGSGTSSHTYTHELHSEKITICQSFTAMGRSYQSFPIDFQLPPIPAYSFTAKDNRINWILSLHIEIPRYPDWKKDIEIELVPENGEKRS